MLKANWRSTVASIISLAALITVLFVAPQKGFAEERKVRTKVAPVYPEVARRSAIMGVVKIQAVISASGQVKSTKAIGGHPLLIGAAEDALKKWKYEPSSEETTTIVEFNFSAGQ